jgi:hypothetical protein
LIRRTKNDLGLFQVALNGTNFGVDYLFIGAELKFEHQCRVDPILVMQDMGCGR